MWNMPSIAMGFSAVFASLTVPICQKPPRPEWPMTELWVLWAGPIGEAGALPLQLHEPSKSLSFAISGAGFGISMPAAGVAIALAAGLAGFFFALACAKAWGVVISAAATNHPVIDRGLILSSSVIMRLARCEGLADTTHDYAARRGM